MTSVVEEKPSAVTSVAEEIRIMPMTTKETNAGRRRGRKHPPTHQTESLQFLLDDGHFSSPPLPPAVDVDVDAAVPRNKGNRSRKQTAGNTCGATSSSSSKRRGKPSTPTLSSDPRVVRALEEAEYEAGVDPYRGMAPFFSLTNAIDNNNDDSGNTTSQPPLPPPPPSSCLPLLPLPPVSTATPYPRPQPRPFHNSAASCPPLPQRQNCPRLP